MEGPSTPALDRAIEHFQTHGWARLGRVLDAATLERLRQRADDIMLGRHVVPGLFFQHDSETGAYDDLTYGEGWVGPSLGYRKIEKLERDDVFRQIVEHPTYARVARRVIDGAIAIYRAVLFTKAAGGGSNLPWHQDGGKFWGLSRDPELTIWTGLDDAGTQGGCVEVLPGSHLRGLATPLGGVVPEAFVTAHDADRHALALPTVAGEALLIHNHTWHRSARTASGHARRGFTVCYMSAETKCLRKKRAPREFVRVFEADRGEGG